MDEIACDLCRGEKKIFGLGGMSRRTCYQCEGHGVLYRAAKTTHLISDNDFKRMPVFEHVNEQKIDSLVEEKTGEGNQISAPAINRIFPNAARKKWGRKKNG